MKFVDSEIEKMDLGNPDNVFRLIVRCLCGETCSTTLFDEDKILLKKFMDSVSKNGLNYEQFNELLLLLNQNRVEKPFFDFFFKKNIKSLEDIKKGVIEFRGYAMLCFGNFRFAYKQLISKKTEAEFKDSNLKPYCEEPPEDISKFEKRPCKMLAIEEIKKEETWYTGELTGNMITKNIELLKSYNTSKYNENDVLQFEKRLLQMAKRRIEINKKAIRNTDIYLSWDYMDVYVATSMRHKWEFEETFHFINKVFKDKDIQKLNLRYFDPTQSKCSNSRDKGLTEGLMLKRALCTIYMAQESDTMGKDSELAATLAQSTPVIAYVPECKTEDDYAAYTKKIRNYPLNFFKKRLLILEAEEVFSDPECSKRLSRKYADFKYKINKFLEGIKGFRNSQPFALWIEKDQQFKQKDIFNDICQILTIAESYNFEKRAELLKGIHPLSMQVDLQSGVANGVLVVRNSKECSDLLYRILTNSMEFKITHEGELGKGFTVLKEKISESPFRVVTDNERLTNSFWNLFA